MVLGWSIIDQGVLAIFNQCLSQWLSDVFYLCKGPPFSLFLGILLVYDLFVTNPGYSRVFPTKKPLCSIVLTALIHFYPCAVFFS